MAEARGFASSEARFAIPYFDAFRKERGGSEGIRTSESLAALHDFESCAFNHSATLPSTILTYFFKIWYNSNVTSKGDAHLISRWMF